MQDLREDQIVVICEDGYILTTWKLGVRRSESHTAGLVLEDYSQLDSQLK